MSRQSRHKCESDFPVSRDWEDLDCLAVGCMFNRNSKCGVPSIAKFGVDGRCIGFKPIPLRCKNCDNYRYILVLKRPVVCNECNYHHRYKIKEIEYCLGCGGDISIKECACPAGTQKSLVRQD